MSTEATRQYNWVNDKNASVPITASRMDGEFDAIITKLNQKAIIKSSAPSSPIEGMLWYDSTNKVFKVYRNSSWVEVVDAVNNQTVAGVKTFSSQVVLSAGVKTDTISEDSSDTGVTVDGCLIKDGKAADSNKVGGYAYNATEIKPFGTWESKTFGTVYQASTDGFVLATISNDDATHDFYIVAYTDGSNPPTTKRAEIYIDETTIESANQYWFLCMPVRKGDYWRVVKSDYTTARFFYWLPMGI